VTPRAMRADVGALMFVALTFVGRLSPTALHAATPKRPATANLAIAEYDIVVIRHLLGTRKSEVRWTRPGARSGVTDTGVRGAEMANPLARPRAGRHEKPIRSAPCRPRSSPAWRRSAAQYGRRHPRGGEREENVPTKGLALDPATLTPRRVKLLPLPTRTFVEPTIARHRAK